MLTGDRASPKTTQRQQPATTRTMSTNEDKSLLRWNHSEQEWDPVYLSPIGRELLAAEDWANRPNEDA